MTSFPVDMVLLVALVLTTACVVLVYRKLKELEAHQARYEKVLAESSAALITAHQAVSALNTDGRELLFSLGAKIEQAHDAIAELERRDATLRRVRTEDSSAHIERHMLARGA